MAKKNKGPALFEVIRAAQQREAERQQKLQQQAMHAANPSAAANLLKAPSNWFKSKRAKATPDEPVMRETPTIRTVERKPAESAERKPAQPSERKLQSTVPVVESKPRPIVEARPPVEPKAEPKVEKFVPLAQRVEARASEFAPVVPPPTPAAPEPRQVAARPADERPPRVFPERAETSAAEAARRVREEIAASSRQETPVSDRDAIPDNISALFTDPLAERDAPPEPFWRRLPPQINYYTAGIVAGVVLVAGMLVYLVNHDRAAAREVARVADPSVMEVRPTSGTNTGATTPKPFDSAVGRVGQGRTEVGVEKVTPIKPPTSVKRVIGQQYIVVMSVPPKAEATADEIVKHLADNGIAATKEKALPGYSPTWFSVVTARGFERTQNNADYQQYADRVTTIMKNYAKGSKFVSTFKLDLYTWRARPAAN